MERSTEILKMLNSGATFQEIANVFGISRQRVYQIADKNNFNRQKHKESKRRPYYRLVCHNCNKQFLKRKNREGLCLFCSRNCVINFKRNISTKENSPRKSSPNRKDYKEYRKVWVKEENKYKYIHRIVMEEKLGRKLLNTEHVHHRNGNSLDNREANLEILPATEHSRKTCSNSWKIWLQDIYPTILDIEYLTNKEYLDYKNNRA